MDDYELLNGGALILCTLSFHVFIFKILSISLVQCNKKKSQEPSKLQQQPKAVASSSSKPKGESNVANANKMTEQKAVNSNKKGPKESAKNCGESENKLRKEEGDGEEKKSEHTEKDSPPIKPAEELRPKKIARNAKEERIAKGKEIRGKGDYPTMDDVLSDWDSEKDGKKDKTKQSEEQGEASKAVTNLEEPDENKPASKGDDAPTKPDGPPSEEKDKSAKGSKKEEKSNKSKEESKQKSNRNEEKKEGQDSAKKDEEKKDAQKDSRQGECQKDEEKKEKSTSKNDGNKEHPGIKNECEKKGENDKQKASAQDGPNDEKNWPQKTDVTEADTFDNEEKKNG